jgi:hypothetical protein
MFFQRCVLLFTGLIVLIQTIALSQQIELGSRTYKLKDSKWYNYSSGQQGDEIYPYRLIVRLQNRQTPSPTDFTHPNPFNSTTTIRFELANERHITLEIYDVLGRRVQTLIDTKLGTGTHAIRWNGRNTFDHEVASGLYFVLLQTPMDNDTRKVLLVR